MRITSPLRRAEDRVKDFVQFRFSSGVAALVLFVILAGSFGEVYAVTHYISIPDLLSPQLLFAQSALQIFGTPVVVFFTRQPRRWYVVALATLCVLWSLLVCFSIVGLMYASWQGVWFDTPP